MDCELLINRPIFYMPILMSRLIPRAPFQMLIGQASRITINPPGGGGVAIYLGSNLVSWNARKQKTVSRSSTESEYKALVDTVAKITWLETLLHEIRILMPTIPNL